MERKIIITLGPSTFNMGTLNDIKKQKINLYRINLSHTKEDDLPKLLTKLKNKRISPICIDTEGAQIRTYNIIKQYLNKGSTVYINNLIKKKKKNLINLYPKINLSQITKGTEILIGFDNLKIKILSNKKNVLKAKVIQSGLLENNKGVHIINKKIFLNPLTNKDIKAIKIAKKFKVRNFALSFANDLSSIKEIKKYISKGDTLISKIETKKGFQNRREIINNSDIILIDRGDLSRYVPIEKIPLAQKIISNDCKKNNKELYIATNLLETMIKDSNPTRAESNDIFNSLNDGATGLVLAAETAIGQHPVDCIKFLKKCIKAFKQSKNKKKFLFK